MFPWSEWKLFIDWMSLVRSLKDREGREKVKEHKHDKTHACALPNAPRVINLFRHFLSFFVPSFIHNDWHCSLFNFKTSTIRSWLKFDTWELFCFHVTISQEVVRLLKIYNNIIIQFLLKLFIIYWYAWFSSIHCCFPFEVAWTGHW